MYIRVDITMTDGIIYVQFHQMQFGQEAYVFHNNTSNLLLQFKQDANFNEEGDA